MSWKAFTDYFWVKEPHPTPEIDDFFLNRTIGPLILVVLNSILACFAFFVIWTQSSSLGSFKWYMLNQLVIAQAMEFALWLISPVMMGSYMAFYAAGVYGYFATTKTLYLSWFIGLAGAVHIFFGIYLSLFNRFVFLFKPHLKKWLHNKYTFALIVLCHAGFHAIYIWAAESSVMNHDDMVELARNESGQTFDPWLKDPRFVYFSEFEGRLRAFAFIVLCIVIMVFLNLVGLVIWFIVMVFILKRTSKTLNDNSAHLLITVLVQTGSCLIFLVIPCGIVLYCLVFAIDGSGNFVNAVFQLFVVYGTTDMLIMLYFIRPYKIYCIKLFRKIFKIKPPQIVVQFVSTQATSSMY